MSKQYPHTLEEPEEESKPKRKATIAVRCAQSGVAVAPPTDLEQAVDTWIEEWMERRGEEEQAKNAQSIQIKQEKEKAAIKPQNLTKTLSEKRTFQEVATLDLTDSDTVRDKRRKTGKAWASRKDKEMQENWDRLDRRDEETLALMRDILNAISATPATSSANTSIPATSSNSTPVPATSSKNTPVLATSSNTLPANSPESSASASSTERRLASLETGMSEIQIFR
ncbi:hypothetical protein BGX38DRAFT_1219010 [Terfezia claveryi]|nr:hypothetical protein BGX38DRAFT_1219010 [Terfezia claveryi]